MSASGAAALIYGPRIADEELNEDSTAARQTRFEDVSSSGKSEGSDEGKEKQMEKEKKRENKETKQLKLPASLSWIPANFTWSKLKPVIRCAVVAWVSVLFVIVPQTSKALGQAAYLILIAVFISPPNDPFISVLEKSLIQIFFVAVAWAWSCLGIKLSSLTRTIINNPSPAAVFSGQYLEAAPTAILAVFLFIGSAVALYIKQRMGPSPFLFASIFAIISLDISFTTAVLFPYPYYHIGQAILVPIAINGGLSILFSIILFPSTMSSLYASKCHGVMRPLISMITEHRKLLKETASGEEFSASSVNKHVSAAEAALAPVGAILHLLKRDIVWSPVGPPDVIQLHSWARRIVVRGNGMSAYFSFIDPTRERFPVTPAPSHPASPVCTTPYRSRSSSPHRRDTEEEADQTNDSTLAEDTHPSIATSTSTPAGSVRFARRRHLPRLGVHHPQTASGHEKVHHRNHHQHHLSHGSLLHLAISRAVLPSGKAVGAFESQRYIDIESRFQADTDSTDYTEKFHSILSESCDELLEVCVEALTAADSWLDAIFNNKRFNIFSKRSGSVNERKERLMQDETTKAKLDEVLERFRKEKRHLVIDPYRSAFDQKLDESSEGRPIPPHRHLFHCYTYQYHLLQFGLLLSELMEKMIRLEKERTESRLWFPTVSLVKFLSRSTWTTTDGTDQGDDEDPDTIPGMEPEWMEDLGIAKRRDPDALPPRNSFEWVMTVIYKMLSGLTKGNALYALKAGVFTVVLAIPTFIRSSALFAYQNKFVWGIILGQLTLVRFRGDTTFGLFSRILSTFGGGLLGAVVWYISTGTGHGNSYGLAAASGVAFPIFFYARLYWPIQPITNIVFFVTTVLVIGYSWLDTHPQFPTLFDHWGIDLAIRRFILVTAGVTAAFIFSFLPPTTTLRTYQRNSLATVSGELGNIYCSILSFANTKSHSDEELQEIIQSLIAIRLKLKRSIVLRANIVYEFSLRGRWPAKRYQQIIELQLQAAYLLSHMISVVTNLEPAWSKAFLRRSRFLDADFQGEVLAVISMLSTSLRTGNPLPQITPCPLVDRFSRYSHGLNIVREEADAEYGLPKAMTIDTLESEQYMFFCVGVTTAFGIIHRLDRLMIATKELVGEQYHIHGIGLLQRGGEADGVVRSSGDVRPAKDA